MDGDSSAGGGYLVRVKEKVSGGGERPVGRLATGGHLAEPVGGLPGRGRPVVWASGTAETGYGKYAAGHPELSGDAEYEYGRAGQAERVTDPEDAGVGRTRADNQSVAGDDRRAERKGSADSGERQRCLDGLQQR